MPNDSLDIDGLFTFFVVKTPRGVHSTIQAAFLIEQDWDDWFEFSTLYSLVVFDGTGNRREIGNVKIGQFQMQRVNVVQTYPKSLVFSIKHSSRSARTTAIMKHSGVSMP